MRPDRLRELLRCPRCRAALHFEADDRPRCSNSECAYARDGFPIAQGQPVLIDFEASIFSRDAFADRGDGGVLPRPRDGSALRWVRQLTAGGKRGTLKRAAEFVAETKTLAPRPSILVIGGGERGTGTEPIYGDADIDVVGTDVYASALTSVVADGHRLPFADASFEGVWIQAVLEHVLEPIEIVREIHRVLKPRGVVYADTPFMQPVHERAYDFTRFSLSGHRWLFRHFEQIDAGVVGGVGTSTIWALRYMSRAFVGNKPSRALATCIFWLRYLDRLAPPGPNADGAAGVYFFGRRSTHSLSPKDMVPYYESARG